MPQMVFGPCMAGTMVEAASPVKARLCGLLRRGPRRSS